MSIMNKVTIFALVHIFILSTSVYAIKIVYATDIRKTDISGKWESKGIYSMSIKKSDDGYFHGEVTKHSGISRLVKTMPVVFHYNKHTLSYSAIDVTKPLREQETVLIFKIHTDENGVISLYTPESKLKFERSK